MPLARHRAGLGAAWLGILALSLNLLIPIHLILDLGDVRDDEPSSPIQADNFLAALVGHREGGGELPGGDHRHVNCAVCGTLAALTGIAPTAGIALPMPGVTPAIVRAPAGIGYPTPAPPPPYRSRAPPLG